MKRNDRHVALIRGINVGKAKRVAMADLRAALEDVGYSDVKTLLNSGNVVFSAGVSPSKATAQIEDVLANRLGVPARVTVVSGTELLAAVEENPLLHVADDFSRFFVAFVTDPSDVSKLKPLAKEAWEPEVLALGARVAYLWCPGGALDSPLSVAVGRALRDGVTIRNWATILKIHAVVQG